MDNIYKEIKGCKEGETNSITRDFFCKLRREFCKHLNPCPLGYKREEDK